MRAAPEGTLIPVRPRGTSLKLPAVTQDARGTNGEEVPFPPEAASI